MMALGYTAPRVDSDPERLSVIVKELFELLGEVNVKLLVVKRGPIENPDGGLRVPDTLHVDKAMFGDNEDINYRPYS